MERDLRIGAIAHAAVTSTPLAESAATDTLLDTAETRIGADVLPGHYQWRTAGASRTVSHDLWLERDGRFRSRLVTTRNAETDVQAESVGVWRREGATLRFTSSEGNPAIFGASGRQRLIDASQNHLVLGTDEIGIEYEWIPEPTILHAATPAFVDDAKEADPTNRVLLLLLVVGLLLLLLMGGQAARPDDEAANRSSK